MDHAPQAGTWNGWRLRYAVCSGNRAASGSGRASARTPRSEAVRRPA